MGMDVYGKQPISEDGAYFRNNVWWWRPLWEFCLNNYPDLTSSCKHGHSNSGDGLDAKEAYLLGVQLQKDIDAGHVAEYERDYDDWVKSLPDHDCEHCNATGKRLWPAKVGPNDTDQEKYMECNACSGSGRAKDFQGNYPFTVGNVQEFSRFLVCCGGFNIW